MRGPAPGAGGASPERPAAHNASWPPAECPITATRSSSSGACSIGEVIDRGGDVLEGRGPAAALVAADPAVLDVPCRVAATGGVGRERAHHDPPVARRPRTPVDRDQDGMRAGAARQVQIRHLAAVRVAVAVGAVGRRDIEHRAGAGKRPPAVGGPHGAER